MYDLSYLENNLISKIENIYGLLNLKEVKLCTSSLTKNSTVSIKQSKNLSLIKSKIQVLQYLLKSKGLGFKNIYQAF